jgi:hypothetical protein
MKKSRVMEAIMIDFPMDTFVQTILNHAILCGEKKRLAIVFRQSPPLGFERSSAPSPCSRPADISLGDSEDVDLAFTTLRQRWTFIQDGGCALWNSTNRVISESHHGGHKSLCSV